MGGIYILTQVNRFVLGMPCRLTHYQVVVLILRGRPTHVRVVKADDIVVEIKETQQGREGNLHEYETILSAMRPKILEGLFHLFWFSDSTMGLRSECHEGMRAAMRLSTAQQRNATRKSVGVKNIWKSNIGT